MTTINKLTIRGIRSFGSETEDQQKIEFTSPLTLIVGQNGCGKTTVIECLKFALTGDKPPGTDNGRTFVHDPNVSKVKTAFAQVKLTVTNSKMVEKQVVRSMRSEVQKGGKLKFETLDSTVITVDPVKGRDDVTGRVEDINNNMCQFMGVSKAIINNVIFCHQEDSNWPLDEGKKLKEKFDAIFGTTEYNKAIDKFIKMRKNYQTKLVETQGNKKLNQEVKEQAEKMERNLKIELDKCAQVEELKEEAKVKMEVLEKKKEEILKREQSLAEIFTNRNKFKHLIETKSDDYNSLKVKIKRQLSGSMDDLEQQLTQFQEHQEKKQTQKQKLESECTTIVSEEKKCLQAQSTCKASISGINDKLGAMQELSGERYAKMKEICGKLDIPFDECDQSVDTQQLSGTFDMVEEKIAEHEQEFEMMKIESSEADQMLQSDIDKLRDERTKLDTEIANLARFISSTKETHSKIKEEIQSSEQSIPILNQLKPKIANAEKILEELKNENERISSLKDDQEILEMDKIEIEDELRSIETDIEVLHAASKITDELALKQNDLNFHQKDFDRIKNKILPNLKILFGNEMPDSNYRAKVTKKKESLESEVKSLKDQLLNIQRDNDRTVERRSNIKKLIDSKCADLKKIQDNIDEACKGNDYLSYLASQKDKVAKLSMELAVLRSSENTYTDYIKKIEENPNCPICHKCFEHDEGENVKVELQENIQELPKKIDSIQKKLKVEQKIYDILNSYKSAYDSISKLESEKLKMETEFKKIEQQLKANGEKQENLEENLAEPDSLLQMISSMFIADVIKLDELQRNISNKKKEVEEVAAKVPKNIPKIALNDAKDKRKKLSDSIKAKNESIKRNSEDIKNYQNQLNEAHSEVNNLNAQKNKFQEKVQGIDRLKKRLKELESDKVENERKLKESQVKLEPVKNQLQKAIDEKQKARDESTKKTAKYQKKLNEIKLDKAALERLNVELEKYLQMNLEQLQVEQKQLLKRTTEKNIELEKKRKIKEKEIESINADIANEETTYRNIQDNIDLQKIEKAKIEAQQQLSALEKQFGETDLNKFKRQKMNVISEIDTLNNQLGKFNGTLGALQGSCEKLQEELNEKKYKNAAKVYLRSVYEVHVLQSAIDDLLKYRTALETSLLKFHEDKMEQINQLLREYWNGIYQGNDIDYIMIKTSEDGEGKAVSSEKKRSYNYRVVLSKNGSEVDMRGRCSAGQKVLASLIIRMALADTFSMNCGILALDEPTTNLDSANIRSLCNALARIVSERDDGTGKFMLLVITHDEEFANALERADHFWKLKRDNRGYSRIERVNNY